MKMGTSNVLMHAKTKVAPLQAQTIPRLELLSALLLSRLMVSVYNSLLISLISAAVQCDITAFLHFSNCVWLHCVTCITESS